MLFLFPFVREKFFNPSNSTDQISVFGLIIYFGFIWDFAVCFQDAEWNKSWIIMSWNDAFDKTFNSGYPNYTAITDHLSYMFMLDRWWLHVNGCSMYIWSNCSCPLNMFLYVFFFYLCYAKLFFNVVVHWQRHGLWSMQGFFCFLCQIWFDHTSKSINF